MIPVVPYMILCEDWEADPENSHRLSVIGLLSNINSLNDPPYPLLYREFCVLLILTEGRGEGRAQILCVYEETGQVLFASSPRQIRFGMDLLEVVGISFRFRDCSFPQPGLYSLQFWYNGVMIEERPLRMR